MNERDKELLKEAGYSFGQPFDLWYQKVADLIRADEREAVLDLVDGYAKNNTDLREAIRARGDLLTNETKIFQSRLGQKMIGMGMLTYPSSSNLFAPMRWKQQPAQPTSLGRYWLKHWCWPSENIVRR